jgi:hypothetical protein
VAPNLKSAYLDAAVARLTGDRGKTVNEGTRYRIRIRTADGHDHAVHAQVDTHARDAKSYQVPQIARSFRLTSEQLLVALRSWGPEELRAHLEQFNKEDLLPRNYRR